MSTSRPSVFGAICNIIRTTCVKGDEAITRTGNITTNLLAAGELNSAQFLFNTASDIVDEMAERTQNMSEEKKTAIQQLMASVNVSM